MAVQVPLADVYRMTLDQYHQMIESGGFDADARVELIGGLIVAMSPKTAAHENVIAWLDEWLGAQADPTRYQVRTQSALTLTDSEPEPDVLMFERDAPRPYHPGTAALVIEVCVSSHRRDLREKPPLYAAAGVLDYWVIDVDGREAWTHRDPGPKGYDTVERLSGADELTAAALAQSVRVADVLAAAG